MDIHGIRPTNQVPGLYEGARTASSGSSQKNQPVDSLSRPGVAGGVFSRIGGVFSSILGAMRWVFSKIFFCFDWSSSSGVLTKARQREALSRARTEFLSMRNSPDFKKEWARYFSRELVKDLQDLLVKKFMGYWGKQKGLSGSELHVYVDQAFKDEGDRNQALKFVRDLQMMTGEKTGLWKRLFGPNSCDPKEEMPKILELLIEDLKRAES
jgi:hypothetical protein